MIVDPFYGSLGHLFVVISYIDYKERIINNKCSRLSLSQYQRKVGVGVNWDECMLS